MPRSYDVLGGASENTRRQYQGGGDEEEMIAVAAWNRSIRDFQAQVSKLTGGHAGPAEAPSEDNSCASRQEAKKLKAAAKAKAAAAARGDAGAGR